MMEGLHNFVESPNLPKGRVTVVAAGAEYADMLEKALEPYGVRLLRCPENPYVDRRLSAHIDLSVFHIGGNRFLLSKHAFESGFADELRRIGGETSVSGAVFSPAYPGDAALCALSVGGRAFHNGKFSDPAIKSQYAASFVHVGQGYAKCAACPVSENAAISADRGLAAAMRKQGIEVLEISPGNIELKGFSEGFIGGSAFKLSPELMAFTGRLDMHPDRERILAFLHKHGVAPVYLTERPVFDIGSVIPVCEI